ncbi:ATP-binding cassette domain-containing protein [Candidatus Bathyarchaeota archaeon]|nr:ATP-binding cassette domain-containing protein [Candidatus Bathyarchaeota archaeon]
MALKKVQDTASTSPAICFDDVTIHPTPSMPPLLANLNLAINRGSVVVCSGPLGSGKTMLARSLMGELPTAGGTISVSSRRIAWCEQSPWLPSGTLKDAVCGFCPEDPGWYEQVIRLCCLDEDLSALPNGDRSMIGSRGLNLSGGQRQRVVCIHPPFSPYAHQARGLSTNNAAGHCARRVCSLRDCALGHLLQRPRRQDGKPGRGEPPRRGGSF